ncbi:MAG: hypothetical protein HYS13_16105 [Planctomycetia bacterium]|nr:hypothetical protein [Planctomycetia bacterium]
MIGHALRDGFSNADCSKLAPVLGRLQAGQVDAAGIRKEFPRLPGSKKALIGETEPITADVATRILRTLEAREATIERLLDELPRDIDNLPAYSDFEKETEVARKFLMGVQVLREMFREFAEHSPELLDEVARHRAELQTSITTLENRAEASLQSDNADVQEAGRMAKDLAEILKPRLQWAKETYGAFKLQGDKAAASLVVLDEWEGLLVLFIGLGEKAKNYESLRRRVDEQFHRLELLMEEHRRFFQHLRKGSETPQSTEKAPMTRD